MKRNQRRKKIRNQKRKRKKDPSKKRRKRFLLLKIKRAIKKTAFRGQDLNIAMNTRRVATKVISAFILLNMSKEMITITKKSKKEL